MDKNTTQRLQVSDYEYPGEANAFAVLKKIPLMDKIVAEFLKYMVQSVDLPEVQGDCFRITPETAPEVYAMYKKALDRLDIDEEYPFFAKAEFNYNAYATGGSAPYIVIHSSLIKNLNEEELLFIIGHELGHIKSGHMIYHSMAAYMNLLISGLPFPGVGTITTGMQYAIIHWARMHEYTADRAGAIAAGSIEAGQRSLGRLLGVDEKVPYIHISVEDLLQQNASFEETNKDLLGKIVSTSLIMENNHPWLVNRIQALEEWKNSGAFDAFKK